jgi:hypothetical protein
VKEIVLNGVLKREHLLAIVAYEKGNTKTVGKRIGLKSPGNVRLYVTGCRKNRPVPQSWYQETRRVYGHLFGLKLGASTDVKVVVLQAPKTPTTPREHALRALEDSWNRRRVKVLRRRQRHEGDIKDRLTGKELQRKPAKDGALKPGEFMWTSSAKDEYMACLTLEQAQRIRLIEAFDSDEDGNQRPFRLEKVRAICRIHLTEPWAKFPAPFLGDTPAGIVSIDGNNRTRGQIMAMIEDPKLAARGILMHVIVTTMDVCKQLFNLHGTTPTRISAEVCLANGDGVDPCATHIMNAVRTYGTKAQQSLTVFHGVVCGDGSPSGTGYFSFMPGSTPLPSWAPETADIVLDAWSDNDLWEGVRWSCFKRSRDGSGYSGTGTMRVIGALARDYMSRSRKERARLKKALAHLGKPCYWRVNGPLQVLYNSSLGSVSRNLRVMRGILNAAGLAPLQGWRATQTKNGEPVAYSTAHINHLSRVVAAETV